MSTAQQDPIATLVNVRWGTSVRETDRSLVNPGIVARGMYGDEGVMDGGGPPLAMLPESPGLPLLVGHPWVRFKDDKLCLLRYTTDETSHLSCDEFRRALNFLVSRLEDVFGVPDLANADVIEGGPDVQYVWRTADSQIGLDGEWKTKRIVMTATPRDGEFAELLRGRLYSFAS